MTHRDDMPDNPGDPEFTDPEATSANQAENAEEAAKSSQEHSGEPSGAAGVDEDEQLAAETNEGIDPSVERDVDAALADAVIDADDAEVAEAQADAADDDDTVESETSEEALQRQLNERTEDLQRLNAEYTNYRRRTERERVATVESAKATVITQLLPILDDLELAKQHGDLEEGSPLKTFGDKLREILKGQKLATFGEPGEAFDPEIHEAVQDLSTGDDQVVGTVLRKGYRVGERLVRNAMVIIADPSSDEGQAATDGSNEAE